MFKSNKINYSFEYNRIEYTIACINLKILVLDKILNKD